MNYTNEDGMLIISTELDQDMLYFDDWLKAEKGCDQRGVRAELLEDKEEDEVDEIMEELRCKFHDYCEENGLLGEEE